MTVLFYVTLGMLFIVHQGSLEVCLSALGTLSLSVKYFSYLLVGWIRLD